MAPSDGRSISIEVVYAEPDQQYLRALEVASDCTVGEAIAQSGLLAEFPHVDLAKNKVGIFGRLARLGDRVCEFDRIEIYRPLIADPKELRRHRAFKKKTK